MDSEIEPRQVCHSPEGHEAAVFSTRLLGAASRMELVSTGSNNHLVWGTFFGTKSINITTHIDRASYFIRISSPDSMFSFDADIMQFGRGLVQKDSRDKVIGRGKYRAVATEDVVTGVVTFTMPAFDHDEFCVHVDVRCIKRQMEGSHGSSSQPEIVDAVTTDTAWQLSDDVTLIVLRMLLPYDFLMAKCVCRMLHRLCSEASNDEDYWRNHALNVYPGLRQQGGSWHRTYRIFHRQMAQKLLPVPWSGGPCLDIGLKQLDAKFTFKVIIHRASSTDDTSALYHEAEANLVILEDHSDFNLEANLGIKLADSFYSKEPCKNMPFRLRSDVNVSIIAICRNTRHTAHVATFGLNFDDDLGDGFPYEVEFDDTVYFNVKGWQLCTREVSIKWPWPTISRVRLHMEIKVAEEVNIDDDSEELCSTYHWDELLIYLESDESDKQSRSITTDELWMTLNSKMVDWVPFAVAE